MAKVEEFPLGFDNIDAPELTQAEIEERYAQALMQEYGKFAVMGSGGSVQFNSREAGYSRSDAVIDLEQDPGWLFHAQPNFD